MNSNDFPKTGFVRLSQILAPKGPTHTEPKPLRRDRALLSGSPAHPRTFEGRANDVDVLVC